MKRSQLRLSVLRLNPFRWKLRTLMLAIALLGPVFLGEEAIRQYAGRHHRDRARWHEIQADHHRNSAINAEFHAKVLDPSLGISGNLHPESYYDPRYPPGSPAALFFASESMRYATWDFAMSAHHARVASWYRRSAQRPWVRVPLIPAEPLPPGPRQIPPLVLAVMRAAESASTTGRPAPK